VQEPAQCPPTKRHLRAVVPSTSCCLLNATASPDGCDCFGKRPIASAKSSPWLELPSRCAVSYNNTATVQASGRKGTQTSCGSIYGGWDGGIAGVVLAGSTSFQLAGCGFDPMVSLIIGSCGRMQCHCETPEPGTDAVPTGIVAQKPVLTELSNLCGPKRNDLKTKMSTTY